MSQPSGRTMSTTRIAAKASRIGPDRSRRRRRTTGCSTAATVTVSDLEVSGVLRLDLLALGLDGHRIVAHQLDLAQRPTARILLDQGMHRAQAADVDDELLGLHREH